MVDVLPLYLYVLCHTGRVPPVTILTGGGDEM
jgi:hypothetical protein